MTINYTTLLGLTEPVTGTQSGTWGSDINTGLTDYVEAAIAGAQVISGSQTAVTLSVTTGSSSAPTTLSQAGSGATGSSQYQIIRCTGNPAGLLTITAPASDKTYVVINATSTSQSVKIVGAGPTTGVTIVSGERAFVAWNGSDFVKVGGAAGGTNTQVQYNNGGVFGGVSGATTNGTAITFSTTNLKLQGSSTGVSSFASANSSATDYTVTFPAASTTIPVATQTLTFSGPTAARTITLPDANFTAARTDSAQTFTGVQTFGSNPILSGGTANGVLYLNGSNVATSGSALTFDGTNFATTGKINVGNPSSTIARLNVKSADTYLADFVGSDGSLGFLLFNDSGIPSIGTRGGDQGLNINAAGSTSAARIVFTTAGTERARITSGGNLLVNTTVTPANGGFLVVNSGISTSTTNVIELQQATNGANKAAAAFGVSIGNGGQSTNAADLTFSTASGGSLSERARITSGGDLQIANGNLVMSTSGKGIDFSATAGTGTSELFADYEEGTFTATAAGSTSGTITFDAGTDLLAYTKIGRVVFIQGLLEVSSVSSPVGTSVFVQNLPFTIADLTEYAGRGGTACYAKGSVRGIQMIEGDTKIYVVVDASTITSGDQFYLSFNYIAA
jgi:hypothetical protein